MCIVLPTLGCPRILSRFYPHVKLARALHTEFLLNVVGDLVGIDERHTVLLSHALGHIAIGSMGIDKRIGVDMLTFKRCLAEFLVVILLRRH